MYYILSVVAVVGAIGWIKYFKLRFMYRMLWKAYDQIVKDYRAHLTETIEFDGSQTNRLKWVLFMVIAAIGATIYDIFKHGKRK